MNDIGDLYDRLYPLLFTNRSRAIHYGFWEKGSRTFAAAQLNENVFLARISDVRNGDRVLDAGCGIGGSALWLAESQGVDVTGISLGKKEIAHANRVARRTPSIRARFSVSDIKRTGFTDESFDIVWAIESVLYIADKRAVASEFARVLDSNGRAVIADLYLSRKPETDEEKALLDSFALLSSTSALPTYAEMEDALRTNGFSRTSFSDKRDAVLPTSFLYLMNALLTIPIVLPFYLLWPRGILRIVWDHARMALLQWKGLRSGLFTYGVILAEK